MESKIVLRRPQEHPRGRKKHSEHGPSKSSSKKHDFVATLQARNRKHLFFINMSFTLRGPQINGPSPGTQRGNQNGIKNDAQEASRAPPGTQKALHK